MTARTNRSDFRSLYTCIRDEAKACVLTVFFVIALTGCATVKLSGLERASDPIVAQKYRARGWCGRDWGRKWNEEKASNRTIGSVLVHYDYVDALLAVFSFGLYMPIEIGYRLNPEGVEGGGEVR